MDWQCCLAGSSQRAPKILIISIAMGADYSFYVKTIETHARAFFKVIILSIGSVYKETVGAHVFRLYHAIKLNTRTCRAVGMHFTWVGSASLMTY